jgi:hypothetical protein
MAKPMYFACAEISSQTLRRPEQLSATRLVSVMNDPVICLVKQPKLAMQG